MTLAKRRNPAILDASRRCRIARGSGTSVQESNALLTQFKQMQKMMKQLSAGRLPKMFELKAQVGGERLEVTVAHGSALEAAVHALRPYGAGEVHVDAEVRRVVVPVMGGVRLLADVVRDLDAAGVRLDDLNVRRPTLDDVFLALTGHAAEAGIPAERPAARRWRRRNGEERESA